MLYTGNRIESSNLSLSVECGGVGNRVRRGGRARPGARRRVCGVHAASMAGDRKGEFTLHSAVQLGL